MKTFLHVGCGSQRKERTTRAFAQGDWSEIRLDIDPEVQPDVLGSMTDMAAVPSGSVDAVFSSHNLEHVYPHEVPLAIGEFLRVLKSDGFLVLTCPDAQEICRLVAEDKLLEPAYTSPAGPIAPLDVLWGHRASLAAGKVFMAHRCGFTQRVLVQLLRQCGFVAIAARKRGAPNFDLHVLASRLALGATELRALAGAHFP
jgi:hypothetical protein